jgi:hypothetical protein
MKKVHEYNKNRCKKCGVMGHLVSLTDETIVERTVGEYHMTCGGCRSVQYCCREHQVEDWPNHKEFCKSFKKLLKNYKQQKAEGGFIRRPSPYPLHDIIESGNWRELQQHLINDPSCDINGTGGPSYMSPLHLAAGQGETECFQILLDHGANYDTEDESSHLTPLIFAGWWGHEDIVQLLLNKGVDIDKKTSAQTFALSYASSKLQPHIVGILIKNGADVNQTNFMGWSCIMCTIIMGDIPQEGGKDSRSEEEKNREELPLKLEIIKMLVEAGANIEGEG